VLGFSELHVTLQKLWFLLSRPRPEGRPAVGAHERRAYVALELRVALCSMDMVRDVLPPHDAWDDEAWELESGVACSGNVIRP
jgi:hypothetical protein